MGAGNTKEGGQLPVRSEDEIAKRIVGYLEKNRERMTYFLRWLVLKESPSSDQKSLRSVQDLLCEALGRIDYRCFFKGRHGGSIVGDDQLAGSIYARPQIRDKSRPVQLLLGHCDTVWPVGTLQTMPVYHQGDRLKGPGVFDMKAGLVQMVYALKAIRALGLDASLVPLVLINSDEETGSRHSTRFIRRISSMAARVFVLEPPLGAEGKLKTSRKGGASYAVTIKGKAAHSGLNPQDGASAILELSFLVQKLFALNDLHKGITVNVGMVEGGVQPNMIAPESRAIVELRVSKLKDFRVTERAIMALEPETEGVSLEIHKRGYRPPMEATEGNRRLWLSAREQGRRLGLDLEDVMAGGGSDGNTTSLVAPTLDGLGAVGDGAHAVHEFVFLNRMVERTALLTLLLLTPT